MEDLKIELANIFGFAVLPFVISVVYGCSYCGDKKIPWLKDVLAIVIAIGIYFAVQIPVAHQLSSIAHWGVLAADLIAFVAVTFALLLTYKVLYSGGPIPAEA